MVYAALQCRSEAAAEPAAAVSPIRDGMSFIHIEELDSGTRFTILKSAPAGLSGYLLGRLRDLVTEFQAEQAAPKRPVE
ncbi:hypothetical protein ACFQU2_42195 [Siccirubricoccus deserti]